MAYAMFHLGETKEALEIFDKLMPSTMAKRIRSKISENFCKYDLAYDCTRDKTAPIAALDSKCELQESYIIEADTSDFVSDPCDLVLSVKSRLSKANLVFNNEYFYLFKALVAYNDDAKWSEANTCVDSALYRNPANICAKAVKYVLALIDLQQKRAERAREEETDPLHSYLDDMFAFRREYIVQWFEVNEYYKAKLMQALDHSSLDLCGFSRVHRSLIDLYRDEIAPVVAHFKEMFAAYATKADKSQAPVSFDLFTCVSGP